MAHLKNIAVLYDIENLVGGYNLKHLSEVSLKNILLELKKKELGSIAIQKAYADWSNYRFQSLKWEIAELGIEPIQMYGFSKASMKNASDIQLVIDTMEILHTKPFITTIVIVSGDGGFSSLVKKLSEYGKKVIGCAYRESTNTIFSQICDDFIYIEETLSQEQLKMINSVHMDENKKKQIIENPILKSSLHKIQQIESITLEDVENQTLLVLNCLKNSTESKDIMSNTGLNISILKSALNYSIKDFDYKIFGFPRLTDFIRYITFNSGLKLILKEPSDYRLVFENVTIKEFKDVEFLKERINIHSKEFYLSVLSQNKPLIKIPNSKETFQNIVNELVLNRNRYLNRAFEDIIEDFINIGFDENDIKQSIYLLINCSILLGDNSSAILSEQSYYFKAENKTEVLELIKTVAINKLSLIIKDDLDEIVIEEILKEFY